MQQVRPVLIEFGGYGAAHMLTTSATDAVAKSDLDTWAPDPGVSGRLKQGRPGASRRADDDDEDDRRYEGEGIVADDEDYD